MIAEKKQRAVFKSNGSHSNKIKICSSEFNASGSERLQMNEQQDKYTMDPG